jgi:uncharacterized membrane protein (UPF0127 family)
MRIDRSCHIFLLTFLFFTGCAFAGERVCLRKACFSVDVMRTDAERARGLMSRQGLDEGQGMFFVFNAQDVYPFWMKNMFFAIDILWIDKNKRVVHIESNVAPCIVDPCPVYTPAAKAMYVLEIPAGDAVKNGITVGDTLR